MTLFDTHVHLAVDPLVKDIDGVLGRSRAAGVTGWLSVATDLETGRKGLEFVRTKEGVLAAVGVHPEAAGRQTRGWDEKLERLIEDGSPAALGECGMDAHHPEPSLEVQEPVFRTQVRLARKHQLPLVMHTRKTTWQVLRILEEENALDVGGVFHCIEADEVFAKAAIKAGFHLGVGGTVTFPKNQALRDMLKRLPLDRIVLETDAPWLAPQPARGKTNEPALLVHIAQAVADAMKRPLEEVAAATTAGALGLFARKPTSARET